MAVAPVIPVAVLGGLVMGVGFGMFLAVDWALLTDLVPKASAGRYMGISNVATATAGLVGLAVGGLVIDLVQPLRERRDRSADRVRAWRSPCS